MGEEIKRLIGVSERALQAVNPIARAQVEAVVMPILLALRMVVGEIERGGNGKA